MPKGTSQRFQTIENAAQLEAFNIYIQLGIGRSLRLLEGELRARSGAGSPCLATLERWSVRFNWQARLAEHVTVEAGKAQDALREMSVAMSLAHMQAADHGLTIAMAAIRKGHAEMPVSVAVQLLSVVSRMRESLLGSKATIELTGPDGGPVQLSANVVTVDLSRFTLSQLDRFEQLIQEVENATEVTTVESEASIRHTTDAIAVK